MIFPMKKQLLTILALAFFAVAVPVSQTGCATTQINNLRKKIPAGYAETLNARVTTLGGWGGAITGKNIESNGRGSITADEYTEDVATPWVTYSVSMTGSGIGKKKVIVKPDPEKPIEPPPGTP